MAKQVFRYQIPIVPGKFRCEVKLIIDERGGEYTYDASSGTGMIFSVYPTVSLMILRQSEVNEEGKRVRPQLNPNDSLSMTRYQMPIMIDNLKGIQKDLKIPDLYSYQGKRLELNEAKAESVRRVFMVGTTTLELSVVVIVQPDESRVEGIKVKFNNEQSSVLLTLNELDSLVYILDHLDLDSLAMIIYTTYGRKSDRPKVITSEMVKTPVVDIPPKEDFD